MRGKTEEEQAPAIVATLETLVADGIGGDPMGTKKWASHSLCHLSQELQDLEYQTQVSPD